MLSLWGGSSDSSNEELAEDVGVLQSELAKLKADVVLLSATNTSEATTDADIALSDSTDTSGIEDEETTGTVVSKYPFTIDELEVGQEFGDFTVKSIKPYDSSEDLSDENASVKFTGEVTVSGQYRYYTSASPLAGEVCITEVDDDTLELLPNIDGRESFEICFSNTDVAQQLFGPAGSDGMGTFTIKDYTVNVFLDDSDTATDTAVLVKATKEN